MSTDTSSIDDILTSQGGVKAPEMPPEVNEPEPAASEPEEQSYDYGEQEESSTDLTEHDKSSDRKNEEPKEAQDDTDEYGNPKPKKRMYTEEEHKELLNKAIRERLSRGNHSAQQPTPQQVQQHADNFEYDPSSSDSWQTQLESFVEQTVNKMSQKQYKQQQAALEQQAHSELQDKIQDGLVRFNDFREVVGTQPISDHMTMALRGMQDPAAFIYAASKRMPAELHRISQLRDPYAQMVEMGKLEERMRQAKPATKAPRPISRSQDDGVAIKRPEKREETIEDMIAASDAKRRAALNARRGR